MARSVTGWKGNHPLEFMPCLVRSVADGEIEKITLGHPLLDDYLAFVAAAREQLLDLPGLRRDPQRRPAARFTSSSGHSAT